MQQVTQALHELREHLLRREEEYASTVAQVHPAQEDSARNLLHHLALGERGVEHLSRELARLGLSSLGGAETHVLGRLDAVLGVVGTLTGRREPPRPRFHRTLEPQDGAGLLQANAEALFGPALPGRSTRIVVTLPTAAAAEFERVRELLEQGVDGVRIDCARDDPGRWAAMVDHVRRAARASGRPCRVLMDLPGPRLRTGSLAPGPRVVKLRPPRDAVGRVIGPARVWLTRGEAPEEPQEPPDVVLPMPGVWLDRLRRGDAVSFTDLRGKRRQLRVTGGGGAGWWAEANDTSYVGTGTRLRIRRPGGRVGDPAWMAEVGELPAVERPLLLRRGDRLRLTADAGRWLGAPVDERADAEPSISCTRPEVLADVRVGDRIWFDEGRIGGVVREAGTAALRIEITWARPQGSRLGSGESIRLPDTPLRVAGLTEDDLARLPFVVQHADLVALSLVRYPRDVQQLQAQLARHGGGHLRVVLKIETRQAFDQLPQLLLQAMRGHPVGVLIDPDDLAVECEPERQAELQAEVLGICDAAHVPVIWSTQALRNLPRTGLPSPGEIPAWTAGGRAACVLLREGPHLREAVRWVDDVLRRMERRRRELRSNALPPAFLAG